MFRVALNALFPARCLGCEHEVTGNATICTVCFGRMRMHRTLFCGTCSARMPMGENVCHKASSYVLGAPGDYSDQDLRAVIHGLKFDGVARAAEFLGGLLAAYARTTVPELHTYSIIPVPLTPLRKRERGFNQSERIALALGAHAALPVLCDVLVRTRLTRPQTEIADRAERRKNVAGCFAARTSYSIPSRIILVDDVATSGATLAEAAMTVRRCGARKILALVAAKA